MQDKIFIFVGAILIVVGLFVGVAQQDKIEAMQEIANKANCAEYNAYNGFFEWKIKDK